MSVTVLVTQARSSLPGGRPCVTPARFLVKSFQFSFDIDLPSSGRRSLRQFLPALLAHHVLGVPNGPVLVALSDARLVLAMRELRALQCAGKIACRSE